MSTDVATTFTDEELNDAYSLITYLHHRGFIDYEKHPALALNYEVEELIRRLERVMRARNMR